MSTLFKNTLSIGKREISFLGCFEGLLTKKGGRILNVAMGSDSSGKMKKDGLVFPIARDRACSN